MKIKSKGPRKGFSAFGAPTPIENEIRSLSEEQVK